MAQGDSADILDRLRSNDQQLIAELTQMTRAVAEKMALPAYVLPADIAQDVFVTLLRALENGTFRGDSSVRTFAYSIAVRTCLYHARELKRVADGEPDNFADPSPGVEDSLNRQDRLKIARKVLAGLPESCRVLWRLMFADGLRYREAAKRLHVKEVTVRERMSSCCRRARDLARRIEGATNRG